MAAKKKAGETPTITIVMNVRDPACPYPPQPFGKGPDKLLGVRIPESLHRRLKAEAVRTGATMAEIVDYAIRRTLANKLTRPLKKTEKR